MDEQAADEELLGYLNIRHGIWYNSSRGRYHVIVNGHQLGVWTKWRWAKRDLRRHLRELDRRSPLG